MKTILASFALLASADDLGYYGATKVKTPRIDSLAADGRKFTDAHSASAVCSPSRYVLLTGSYPLRKNFWGPTPTWTQELTIDPKSLTLPQPAQGSRIRHRLHRQVAPRPRRSETGLERRTQARPA